MRQPTLSRTILLATLCLALVLAGCGSQSLIVAPEQICGESAYIEFTNTGSGELRISGWVIHDDLGDHELPPVRLAHGASLRVWRGAGKGDDANLYLAQPRATWQLANGSLVIERPARWPWDPASQGHFFSCNVNPAF